MGGSALSPRDAVRFVRTGGPAYYAAGDLEMVRRFGGLMLAITSVAIAVLLPVTAPDDTGTLVSGAIIVFAGGVSGGTMLAGRLRPGYGSTLVLIIGALLALGGLEWAAGVDSPYSDLMVLPLVYGAVVHDLRRARMLVAIGVAASMPALVAAGFPADATAESAVHLLVWICLSVMAMVWTAGVRLQRVEHRLDVSRAETLARVDQLTGLGNRRAFDETIASELARAERSGRPLSLLVADMDDFKAINDRDGHLAGDAALRATAAAINGAVRRPDSCFRWGGDEFVIVLPEAGDPPASAIADRIADAVADQVVRPDGEPLRVTVGVAELEPGMTPDELLSSADGALLAAKA